MPVQFKKKENCIYTATISSLHLSRPLTLMPFSKSSGTEKQFVAHLCRPKEFLQELQTHPLISSVPSEVFNERFEDFRAAVLLHDLSPETEIVKQTPEYCRNIPLGIIEQVKEFHRFDSGDRKIWLHMAASNEDIILAHECVRLEVDRRDSEGGTPL